MNRESILQDAKSASTLIVNLLSPGLRNKCLIFGIAARMDSDSSPVQASVNVDHSSETILHVAYKLLSFLKT